ncbi:DUF4376 domain-containing protein [Ectopseudomonas khazarica]|uniref:DUF4376 domain-containing protein n=1 Tax=Ectopseudomonas khazarica TaxID=2502979 RepID=UPI00403372C8
MARYALIVAGIVHSTPEYAERPEFAPSITLIELSEGSPVEPGWLYDGAQFTAPAPQPVPLPTSADVDAERDRRISAGFMFQGVRYQSRLPSANQPGDWDVFSGKALEALIAIMAGALAGDLRWSDPAADFAWIAADNSRVPMDAQTVIELGKAASAHRSRHTFAGSDLKAMGPIPGNYYADHWWPPID